MTSASRTTQPELLPMCRVPAHIDRPSGGTGEREIVVPYRTRARGSEVSVGPVECPAVAFRRPKGMVVGQKKSRRSFRLGPLDSAMRT
jgi:hypothetical protein